MPDSKRFIIPSTDQSGGLSEAAIGGKAWNLWRLRDAGFAVPPWWVVSSNLFEAVIDPHRQAIDELLGAADFTDPASIDRIAAAIQEKILGADLPAAFHAELAEAFVASGDGGRFAVRSSVRGEDSAIHSFAGLMESFLNQRAADLPNCILRVWASAYSARALSYRRQTSVSLKDISAAVVIQEMVMATRAGVLFTRDPGTRQKICVISAAYGLGEGVTSDLVDTDTYRIGWDSDEIAKQVPKKARLVTARHAGGTTVEPLASSRRQDAVLSDDQIRVLRDLAVQAEADFGTPLDMEWAFDDDGSCWMLQARPIVFTQRARWVRIWDNANIVESYPGVTLPLTFSFARELYERTFRQLAVRAFIFNRSHWQGYPVFRDLFGLIDGRVYLNLLNWYHLLSLLPGFETRKNAWDQMFGIGEEIDPPRAALSAADRVCVGAVVVKVLLSGGRTRRRFDTWLQHIERAFLSRDLAALDESELVALYQQLMARVTQRWYLTLHNDFCAMTYYDWLQTLCRRWAAGHHPNLHNDLLRGQTGIESIAPSRSIDRLSRLFAERAEYRALLALPDNSAIWQRIHDEPNFAALKQALDRHVHDFGDRSMEELKLEVLSFREAPERILDLIRDRLAGTTTIGDMEDQAQRARRDSELVMRQSIRNPLKRCVVQFVLLQARRSLANRESMRLARGRLYGAVRRLFQRIGSLLETKGLLDTRRDVFYLTVGEITDFIRGSAVTQDLRAIVAMRRTEYAAHRTHELPSRFQTHGLAYQGVPSVTAAGATGSKTAHGIGCSSGVATGVARVILEPGKAHVEAGDIIVARSTDPAWVYLMTVCKGIVVERGSVLSHTAIIGRELGIPTVVGVAGATERIPDRAAITIDGQTGHIQWT